MIEIYSEEAELDAAEIELIEGAARLTLKIEEAFGDLTVLVTSEQRIRTLNRDFRNIDKVTDVLTFPAAEGAAADGYLGDIMICKKRALEQAEEYGHSPMRELAFLTVHGVLHLLGYDHMTAEEETLMQERQKIILEGLGQKR